MNRSTTSPRRRLIRQRVYILGECPSADQGTVFFYRDTASGQIYLACDVCDASWDTPEDFKRGPISHKPRGPRDPARHVHIQDQGWADDISNPPSIHFPEDF